MSVLNKIVSYFPGIKATTNGINVNLLSILNSIKHKETILLIRKADKSNRKQLKQKLSCYTVAGTFSRRCDSGLIQLSGLAAIDLDSAENYDVVHLLKELKKIQEIAYAGLSCSGIRLFCIVPFRYPEKYLKHYERLVQSFCDMGLPMGDDCHKRISQPRFVSWNESDTQFFNHDAKPYSLLPVEKTYHFIQRRYSKTVTIPVDAFNWCMQQINKNFSFTVGKRHDYILHLARYCNIKGLAEEETLRCCYSFAQEDFSEKEIRNIVLHIYMNQKDSHAKIPLSIKQ